MSDDLANDPWISTTSPIGAKRLHALGLITLRWNVCEFGLFRVFCEAVKLPVAQCWALAHNLGDVALSERITAMAKLRKLSNPFQTRIADVLGLYDICRQNRNFLTHAWFSDETEPGKASLTRRSKKIDEMAVEPFSSTLTDIRRVADDISDLSGRLFHLEVLLAEDVEPRMPSLGKLKMPELLWKHLQVQKVQKPQHPSSQG